jgi:hypothetical protein
MDNTQRLEYNQSNFERKKKIMMICDDEPDMRLLYGLMFESRYDVIMVNSGEECIERYAEETSRGNKISLALLDYNLGGMLGGSAYDVDYLLIKELENGNYISKYIQKPFDTDRLTDLVAEIV